MNDSEVKISWLWPATEDGMPNIGFGYHRRRFPLALAAIGAAVLLVVVLLVAGAPANLLLWTGLLSLGVTIAALAANARHYRYYEVDRAARPTRALTASPPPEISGRRPMTRRTFLDLGANT